MEGKIIIDNQNTPIDMTIDRLGCRDVHAAHCSIESGKALGFAVIVESLTGFAAEVTGGNIIP